VFLVLWTFRFCFQKSFQDPPTWKGILVFPTPSCDLLRFLSLLPLNAFPVPPSFRSALELVMGAFFAITSQSFLFPAQAVPCCVSERVPCVLLYFLCGNSDAFIFLIGPQPSKEVDEVSLCSSHPHDRPTVMTSFFRASSLFFFLVFPPDSFFPSPLYCTFVQSRWNHIVYV